MDWYTVYSYLLHAPWVFWTSVALFILLFIGSCIIGCMRARNPNACREIDV